jgi:hypothetical protein
MNAENIRDGSHIRHASYDPHISRNAKNGMNAEEQ